MQVCSAGVEIYERYITQRDLLRTNTENSWLRYVNNMCIQDTWADALIVQAVPDALIVSIQIVKCNSGFSPITTVYVVQERNGSY